MSDNESKSIVNYGSWALDQVVEDAKEASTQGGFWKVPVGKSVVRFLPPKVGWKTPFQVQNQHFVRLPGVDAPIVFCCARAHERSRCAVCDTADTLVRQGGRNDERRARELAPNKRILANVVVDPANKMAEPVVYGFGPTVFNQLLAIRRDEENGGDFTDPMRGFNVVIDRKGSGKNDTRYTVMPSRKTEPLANLEWIEMQRDLRPMVRVPSYEGQRRLLNGEDPRDVWRDEFEARRGDGVDQGAADEFGAGPRPSQTAEDDLYGDDVDLD